MTDYTGEMAEFIAETKFENLPSNVIHQAKLLILDVMGCAVSGYSHDRGMICREVVKEFGGNPEATILGGDNRTSCVYAAYANSNMASALDNEETFVNAAHFSSTTVFAALALAERGNDSGRELIKAVAIGYEFVARLWASTGYAGEIVEGKVVSTPVVGWPAPMGGVASACSVLKLDKEKVFNALGIAGHYSPLPSAHLWRSAQELPLIKYKDNGWMALGGVMSALLANKGYTGHSGILDGEAGYWKMYGAKSCDYNVMVEGLGDQWWIMETSFKPWPACRHIHHSLTALSKIKNKHNVKHDEVERITVKGSFMEHPQFHDQEPEGAVNPQFSAPHVLAMLMLNIPPGVDWYQPEIMRDPKVISLRKKIKIKIDPRIMTDQIARQISQHPRIIKEIPTTVEVLAKGQVFSETVKYAKGDPWDPEFRISDEELKDKFKLNASSLLPLSFEWKNKIDEAIDKCFRLEDLENVNDLTALMMRQ
ncbi:MAG: MmgE/PrpD family protein [SAR324 cluster bacterium]|nr:MmgE/PrpD family protein [SAR324 cluster bacterium]